MGEDELNILLSAMLDEAKSISNINNQITTIQEKLKNVKISLNIDDFKASIESVFGDIQSKAKKVSSQKLEFQSLDNTIKQIQGLSKNLESIFSELKQIGNVKSVNKIFDDSGNISGFNVKVESLKGNLKELSNYNVLGSLNKDTGTWEYALDRISSKVEEVKVKIASVGNTTTNTSQMSGLQKALDDTVTAYKNGSLKIEEYVTRMQSIMYGKDGTYKTDFTNIPEKQRLEYVNQLTRATNDLDKQTTANNNKQLVALTNQQIAIQKIQTALSDANSKYGGFSNADTTSGLQSQITALQQMNPLTAEYRAGLAVLNNDLNNYTKGLQSASTSANAQTKAEEQASKALVDKKVAIDSLEQKLSLLQGNKLINSGELQNVQQMVARLKEVEAGTVGFRNAAKLATSEVNKLVAQSRAMSTLSTAFKGLAQLLMIGTPLMAIRRVMKEMVSTVNELNASMTDIRLVNGMSADSVEKLRDEYNELGKTIGATTKQIMDSAVEFTRQGRSIAETQTLINAAVMGAKLSGTETSSMTDYLTSAVNGYNVAAKDSISVIDKLVAVDNSSASSMSELSIAMSRTAKSAQMAGVDMDTLIGYIGTIESVTRKSSETVGKFLPVYTEMCA